MLVSEKVLQPLDSGITDAATERTLLVDKPEVEAVSSGGCNDVADICEEQGVGCRNDRPYDEGIELEVVETIGNWSETSGLVELMGTGTGVVDPEKQL